MTAVILLMAMIPAALCIATAAYMAIHGIPGWGWFLFVGCLLGGFKYSEEAKKND